MATRAEDPATGMYLETVLWLDSDGIHDFVILVGSVGESGPGSLLARVDTSHDAIHLHRFGGGRAATVDTTLSIPIPEGSASALRFLNERYEVWYSMMEELWTDATGGAADGPE